MWYFNDFKLSFVKNNNNNYNFYPKKKKIERFYIKIAIHDNKDATCSVVPYQIILQRNYKILFKGCCTI